MNSFKVFQTDSAVMRKIEIDGFGDEAVAASFSVDIDPTFGKERTYSKEQEEITGLSTIITADDLESNYDTTHDRWDLDYNGRTYKIRQLVPFYRVGTDNLEHLEVVMT